MGRKLNFSAIFSNLPERNPDYPCSSCRTCSFSRPPEGPKSRRHPGNVHIFNLRKFVQNDFYFKCL